MNQQQRHPVVNFKVNLFKVSDLLLSDYKKLDLSSQSAVF